MDDSEVNSTADENLYHEAKGHEVTFLVDGHMTRFKTAKAKKDSNPHYFGDFALKIIGKLKNECQQQGEGYWVCQCTGRVGAGTDTRTLILQASTFQKGTSEFCNELNKRWNGGTFSTGGTVNRNVLSDYLLYLKEDYYEQEDQKSFQVANITGFMGNGYWFLSQGLQVQDGHIMDSEGHKYYLVDLELQNKASLSVNRALLEQGGICKEINGRFINLSRNFGLNFPSLMMATSFVISRLLRLSSSNNERQNLGETRVGIIYSTAMNVGKSLTQELLLYGQGAKSRKHTLFVSGGDLIHSGTSLKMLQKLFGQSNLVYSVDDVKSSDQMSEFLLTYHGGLITGSLSHGINTPKASGLLLSSNTRETERLKGRVLHFNYFQDPQFTAQNDEEVKELKRMCNEYSGFLLAWTMKNVSLWDRFEEAGCRVVSKVLQETLHGQQRRWCDAMACTIFTNLLYFETSGVECSFADLVCDQIKANKEARSFMERVCENIWRKIKENRIPILCWLTRNTSVKTSTSARPVRAVGIRSLAFEEFTNISAKELNQEMKVLGDGFSKSMFFAREGIECTENDIRGRKNEAAVSQKGHKFPIDKLPERTMDYINKAITGETIEDATLLQTDENPNVLSDRDIESLLSFQRRVRAAVHEDTIEMEIMEQAQPMDAGIQDAIDVLTPRSKTVYSSYTPRRRESFALGVRAAMIRRDEDDQEEERERTRTELFPEGTIGILPRGEAKTARTEKETEGLEAEIPNVPQSTPKQTDVEPSTSYESAYPKCTAKRKLNKANGNCFCKKYRGGEFVGCDSGRTDCPGYNPALKESWFHVKCLGLSQIPEGKWICKQCLQYE